MSWRNIAYVEVLGVDFIMLGKVEVLLCDEHALYRDLLVKVRVGDPQVLGLIEVVHTTKEVLVNLLPIGLGDKPGYKLALLLL